MKFLKLTTYNFFRFYDKFAFEFSNNPDKNVTVIRGENGTGKTTFLNAFYWCLYGDVTLPLHIDKLLNELAAHKLSTGDITETYVEIVFEYKDHEYTLKRSQTFKKHNESVIRIGDESFSVTYKDSVGNTKPVKDVRGFFDNFIPKNLRGFFFFDGERIDRLAKIDGREEIKQAILDILGLTKLENLKEHFSTLEREFNKEQKKYMDSSEQDLSDEYEALCDQRDQINDDIKIQKESLNLAEENYTEVQRFLATHNSEIVKSFQSERDSAEQYIKNLDSLIEQNNKNKLTLVTKEFKNILIEGCFDSVYDYLESKRRKGELPSDIKAQFIDDLLMKNECICARSLKKGSPEYLAVEAKKANAGRNELDDAYHKLTGYINQKKEQNKDFYRKFHAYDEEVYDWEQEKEAKEKRNREISKKLRESDESEIAAKEELRNKISSDISEYKRKITLLEERDLKAINAKVDAKDKELQNVKLKGEQASAIRNRRDMVLRLAELNQEVRALFIETTRVNLDKRIREVFDTMKEKDYRFARLTDEFVLEITNDLGNMEDSRILSTGEGQVASLAFIGSLVSYAREKLEDKLMSDFSGGDFPIVMDSPFGNLSAGHKQNVAREIGNLASQVIIVVSDEQWSSVVEENIKPRVGTLYKMNDGTEDDQSIGEHTAIRRIEYA